MKGVQMQSPKDKAMTDLAKIRAEIATGDVMLKKSHLLGMIDAIVSLHEASRAGEDGSSKDA